MILDTLAEHSRQRVEKAKKRLPIEKLWEQVRKLPVSYVFPFKAALKKPGLSFICEIKKASPSKGLIAEDFEPSIIAQEYEIAGASAVSVLTEPDFFLGSDEYLRQVKQSVRLPVLRKDFTVDEYQLYEAKCLGADAVLLICALLDVPTIRRYLKICKELGLSALVEAHNEAELNCALEADAEIIGVNNRDLKTFEVRFENCIQLREKVPDNKIFVAESGIQNSNDIFNLQQAGVDAVLIGETLMKSSDKKQALDRLRGQAN